MAGDPPSARAARPIAKLLDAASLDLDAARRLLTEPANVLAANHLQQAAEKLLGAVRLHRGLLNTRDHDLVLLIDGRVGGEPKPLPPGDPWRERCRPLEPLSAYATAFRYSLTPTPKLDELRRAYDTLTTLLDLARSELLSS
jgi:HEPN domain